eukprot:6200253-Pleurochrysis_carterae.AAC.4
MSDRPLHGCCNRSGHDILLECSFACCTERLLIVLRDGKKILGTMRSFDQYANIVLEHAVERVIVGKCFSDVPLGLYVIRGENVVLLGQVVRPQSPSSIAAALLQS